MTQRKSHLIQQLFKVGNLDTEFETWLLNAQRIMRAKYTGVSSEQFNAVWLKFSEDYFRRVKEIYDTAFSEQELEAIIKFWSSDVGFKLIRGDFALSQKQFSMNWALKLEEALGRASAS